MRGLLLIAAMVGTAAASAEEVSFITCPIYRDSENGRKSGCWLADDPATGTRYDVSASASKPDWNFTIMVEGRASEKPGNPCGGVALDPVRASILEGQPCTRHMLPAEGFPGRKYVLPKRNNDPLSVARPRPVPPFVDRTFRLFFDWNSDFIAYQRDDYLLDQAIAWIRGVPVKRIIITGYGATRPHMVSGQSMAEESAISGVRAARITEALFRLGIPKAKLITRNGGNGLEIDDDGADHFPQQSRRRVDIKVELMR